MRRISYNIIYNIEMEGKICKTKLEIVAADVAIMDC